MRRPRPASVLLLATLVAALVPVSSPPAGALPGATIPGPVPSLEVSTVLSGLTNAWDTAFAPDGAMFVTERSGRIQVRRPDGSTVTVATDVASDLWNFQETGLMGIEVDPAFATNRRVYTCQGSTDTGGGALDGSSVQVVAWQVDATYTAMSRTDDPLVGGIAAQGSHSGCQLRVDPQGHLRISTGDAGFGSAPQDPHSLNGKTLRVDRFTGAGVPGNPFLASGGNAALVFTYGHRNVQGLATHPATGEVWSSEHGPDVDDEINRLVAGGNYGWNPVPGYNQAVPMTDLAEFPGAVRARWSSGSPTIATSGMTFLQGSHWGPWQGALAVATLKGSSLRIFRFDGAGNLQGIDVPAELNGTFGRLRSAEMGPCGDLFLTTDAGSGASRVLRVRPSVDLRGPGAVGIGGGQSVAARCGPVDGGVQLNRFDGSAWGGWTDLGGRAASEPDLASWGGGRIDVFVLGLDGAVWHRGVQGAHSTAWESLGGGFTSAPAAVAWAPGRIDVFGRGLDGALWTKFWNGSVWSSWYSLGGSLTSEPDVASWGPNRFDVVARGTDAAIWHRAWTGTAFSPWVRLGGGFTSGPGAVSWSANRIDLFGRGYDGAIWSNNWNGSQWSGWYSLGGFARSAPDAASRAPGTWEVIVEGGNGTLYERRWTGSAFTPWMPLPA